MFTFFGNYNMLGGKSGPRGAGNPTDNSFKQPACRYCSRPGVDRARAEVERAGGIFLLLSEGGSEAVPLLEVREGSVGDVRREGKMQPAVQESRGANRPGGWAPVEAYTAGAPDLESDERGPGCVS